MNWGYFVAILLGIWNSVLMNLAKGMQRHYITIFDKKKKEATENPTLNSENIRKPTMYIIAIIINQLPFLWAMISNMFAPFSYYTSMYGVGLVILLIYSYKVLGESMTIRKIIGAIILIIGTLLLGVDNIIRPELDKSQINMIAAGIYIGVLIVLAIILIPISVKTGKPIVIGVAFGLICGAFQSLDAVIKDIGQSYGVESTGFFPGNLIGWLIFLGSFLSGTFSFVLSQVGFAKKTDASVQVPIANSSFILTPLLFQTISYPGYNLTILSIIGVIIVVTGIMLMQLYPLNVSNHTSIPKS
jgi:drug/metabolite transporter (DMT)-like permease